MKITSNIEQVIQKLNAIAQSTDAIDFSAALTAGVNAALGRVKYRVFNTGTDKNGVKFGKYIGKKSKATPKRYAHNKDDDETHKQKKKLKKGLKANSNKDDSYTEYEKERLARGRQIEFKDLELTGGLRRGIVIVRVSDRKVVAAIPNERLKLIAQGQQKQISRITGAEINIFGLSDEERDILKTNTNEILKEIYAGLFKS